MPSAPTERDAALAVLDRRLRLDPAWRFYRTFAGINQRAIIESPSLYLHIHKPNQVGGTATMLVDAALYLKGIHPVRPRPKEPMQLLFIVPKKAQMGTIFGRRLFKESSIVTTIPAFARILAKEPDLAELGKRPLICPASEAHLEMTGSSMGRVVSKASVPGPYGTDELFFYISGDEKAWETVMGNNYHGIYRDESVAKGQNLMPELRMRVGIHHDRHAIDRPGCGFIRWGCTTLKYSEELKEYTSLCKAQVQGHAQVCLTEADNPAISKQTREAQALGMSASEAKKRVWGTATAMDDNLVLRVDRTKVMRTMPYDLKPEDNLWLAYDPGWKDPCAVGLYAVPRGTKSLTMIGYRSWSYGTTHEHVQAIADLLQGRYAVTIVCDPAIKSTSKVSGISDFTIFCESLDRAGVRLNTAPCLAQNRYETGIPMLQTFLAHQEERSLIFDVSQDGVEEALCQHEAYRYKDEQNRKLLETGIYQKNVQAVDITRYVITRFFQWVDIGSNAALSTYNSTAPEPTADTGTAAYERQYADFMETDGVQGGSLPFESIGI